jgi:hypothetical protein
MRKPLVKGAKYYGASGPKIKSGPLEGLPASRLHRTVLEIRSNGTVLYKSLMTGGTIVSLRAFERWAQGEVPPDA